MDCAKKSFFPLGNFIISFIILASCFVYLLTTWQSPTFNPFYPLQKPSNCSSLSNFTKVELQRDELDMELEKSSNANKTVIIAVVNKAYVEQTTGSEMTMFDLFLESFWLGEDTRHLLDHLLVVAVDQTAYDRCKFKRLHCYKLATDGLDFAGEKTYMSEDFIKLMWRRTLFLLDVLKLGYNFIFTDTDIMWVRNPFPSLMKAEYKDEDLHASVDVYFGDKDTRCQKFVNTGFYYIKSNNKTIALFDKWYSMKDNSTGKKEQDVFADLMLEGFVNRLNMSVRFLDNNQFSGFCHDSKDVGLVKTVHANCCPHINAKLRDLTAVLRDWKRYKKVVSHRPSLARNNVTSNVALNFTWTGHHGCQKSWHM
ncbi:hypothetical protein ACFE04_026716 [Oxalis oulophora]